MGIEKIYVKLEDGSVLYGAYKDDINLSYDKLFEKERDLDQALMLFKRNNDITRVSYKPMESVMYSDPSLYNLVEAEIYSNINGGIIWYGEINIEKNCLVSGRSFSKLGNNESVVLDGDPDWVELTDDGFVRNVDDIGIYKFQKNKR